MSKNTIEFDTATDHPFDALAQAKTFVRDVFNHRVPKDKCLYVTLEQTTPVRTDRAANTWTAHFIAKWEEPVTNGHHGVKFR